MQKIGRFLRHIIVIASLVSVISTIIHTNSFEKYIKNKDSYNGTAITISVPTKYPETAKHIKDAINKGLSAHCTIDRPGAKDRREKSLRDVPTKPGYDRDEFPMAMCLEGGLGADIRYIKPADNRGAGAWVGRKVSDYPDGTVIKFNIN